MKQTVEKAAVEYVKSTSTCYVESFIAGAEWRSKIMRQEVIEAHWKCCPNLSKDNDLMCNHSLDCNQKGEYMKSFIKLLEEYT